MNSAPHRLGLGAAAVTASLALGGALLVGPAGSQAADGAGRSTESLQMTTSRALAFHDHMRRLWEDHVAWTRMAIVTFADGSAGFGATARRLLRNQEDIGATFGRFYGTHRGERLASLLHDHITIAVQLLQAAKAGDQAAVADASGRWYANARDIADLLSTLNRHTWPRQEMRSMMRTHLDQTLAEAVDELTGHYHRGVREYGAIERHILEMADALSGGIEQQFPGRFSG